MKAFKLYNLDTPPGTHDAHRVFSRTVALIIGFRAASSGLRLDGNYHSRHRPSIR